MALLRIAEVREVRTPREHDVSAAGGSPKGKQTLAGYCVGSYGQTISWLASSMIDHDQCLMMQDVSDQPETGRPVGTSRDSFGGNSPMAAPAVRSAPSVLPPMTSNF